MFKLGKLAVLVSTASVGTTSSSVAGLAVLQAIRRDYLIFRHSLKVSNHMEVKLKHSPH